MDPYANHSPLTLPVHSLSRATDFYLAALEPLAYQVVTRVSHQPATGRPRSDAVGLGPSGTSRVDVFLSRAAGASSSTPTHVCFPAPSRAAVREFYAAALNAGASPVSRPDDESGPSGDFVTCVLDPYGNRIEVFHSDSPASASTQEPDNATHDNDNNENPVQRWRKSVASSVGSSIASSMRSASRPPDSAISLSERASDSVSRGTSKPRPQSSERKSGVSSTVIGTAIGAATGAALVYGMLKSKNDSVAKERDFASRMDARTRRVKDEAWAHQRHAEPWSDPIKKRYTYTDRDSGERGSGYFANQRPPPPRYEPNKRLSITVPDSDSDRGRSVEYRLVSHRPRPASPYRDSPRRRSTVRESSVREGSIRESSQSTARPHRRSSSMAGSRHYDVVPWEKPPSMPPMPATRPRRDSRGSEGYGRTRMIEMAPREAPPSSYAEVRRSDSRRSESRRSRSVDRPPSTHSSTRTARYVPLPASVATTTARNAPLPPSAPPSSASAALTARALAQKESADGPGAGRGAGKLDDLRTVVPDDSISCAPTNVPADERRGRSSRVSRTRSRASRHDERPRSGVVMG